MIEPQVIEPEVQQEEPAVTDPGNPKLKKLHEVLVKQGFAVPTDYDKFEKVISNPDKAKAFHGVLVKQGFAVPTDYEKFSSALGLGEEVKKKDQTAADGGEPSSDTGLPPSEAASETQKKIEEALRLNPEAVTNTQVPQEVVSAPGQDATRNLHQAFVPKPVLEKNAKDAQLKQHLEDEYKKSIDNGIPGYEHFAGQFNKAVIDAVASIPKTVAIVGKFIDDKLGLNNGAGDKANVENYTTYKAGQWLQDTAKELGFTNTNPAMAQDFWSSAVPQGLGSVAAIAMTGMTREAGTMGLQMMGKEAYTEVTKQMVNVLKQPGLVVGGTMMGVPEYEQAKKAGADDDTAFKVFVRNYVIGMTDAIPIGRAFDRLNKLTDHSLVKVLKNGFQGGGEEFIQEGVQNYLTNLTAKEYYDKSRDLFEGMATDAGAGFIVGFLLSAIGGGAAHLPRAEREKVDKFIAEKEKEYHQAFGGAITDDHISKPESNIQAPLIPEPKEQTQPKPEKNAIPIQGTTEIPVQPTPGNSETLEQGVPESGLEVAPGTQGRQTEAPAPQNQPEVRAPQREGKESQIKVSAQPVEDISVDHQRFQNRDEAYSKKSVDKIINAVVEGKFDVNEFDPIRTWRDPKNGKTYVLSGHSRTEAFRRLQQMLDKGEIPQAAMDRLKAQGITDFKHIPSIDVSNKSEAEAKKFAEASNTLATQESDLERAKLIKKKRSEGQSLVSIRKEVGATRGQELLSNLKQNGKAWDAIKAVENSETVENKRRVYQVGEFIGEARHLFPHLTDSHENEMYDYLTEGRGKNIKTRQEFIERMDNIVNHIGFMEDTKQPLNLENRVSRGSNESEALQELNELKKRRGELESERDDKKKIPPASRLDEISREIGTINKEIVRATENIGKAKAGDRQQTDLFAAPAEKTEPAKEQPGEDVPVNEEGRQKVFVYGTLKNENTRTEALGGDVKASPATAPNEEKHNVEAFPEIEHEEGRNLRGDVIEVTPEQIKRLDQWEKKYERDVITLYNGDKAYVYKLKPGEIPAAGNESSTTTDLEPNRTRKPVEKQVGEENVPEDTGTSGQRTRNRKPKPTEAGLGAESNPSLSDLIPPTDGKPGDTGVDKQEPEPGVEQRPGRGADDSGSGPTNEPGIEAKPNTAKQPARSTHAEGTSGLNIDRKLEQQRDAEGTGVVTKDLDNIKATLPMLLPHQIENVMKAETRFYNPPKEGEPNKGILFTDGTGTGKTYTGLGIAKRFVKQGKKNVLIVVPTETKAEDWIGDGKNLLLDIHRIPDTKSDGGEGSQVVTTYANFRANEVLGKRKFDLVIYDESHKLVSNQAGDQTEADKQHKEITNSPSVAQRKATEKFQSLVDKDYKDLGRLSDNTKKYIAEEKQKLLDQTKVVFLSATPFSYHQNLKYGDGYLFTMREGVESQGSRAYNAPSPEQQFYVQNFGYRMRYNKLTVPESGVDVSLMERMFHSGLVKKGAVSSKKLQLDKDYSREFVLIDDKLGLAIDEGVKLAGNTDKYNFLPDIMRKKFNWLYQNQLLEAIKAKNIVDRIRKHVAMGRKVVVFHSYVNSLPSHPFDLSDPGLLPLDEKQRKAAEKEIRDFHAENPGLQQLDLRGLINPVKTLQKAFGDDVLVFNGTVPAKLRKKAIHDFNIDEGGKDILVVQMESGKEGISLHDVTGNHQRVEINLALPYKPTDAIQSEGRVYRIGQMSDAIIEYAVLHLDFEKLAFANKINERVKTAENLAFGEEARNLEDAFKEGYKDANLTAPSDEQGKGGKESDNTYESIDDYERAKSFYYARQKRTSKNKAQEGTDYFATPEPVGFKMVQWLKSMPGEHLLEPSAGHGAIARFFPGNTENKFIEQSQTLRPDLAINTVGELLPIRNFEDLHAVNKFHGIAMNPPFGTAGKTAWEHVNKALDHLKDGGRVVAIVPQGPSIEKCITAWLESDESKNYVIRAVVDLPSVTFARAGTGVNTQILVIDRVNNEEQRQSLEPQKKIDLTRIEKVESLFDRIKEMEMPNRVEPKEDAAHQVLRQLTQSRSAVIDIVKTGEKQDYEFIKGKNTKYGTDIYTVKLNKRLDASEYAAANRRAKALDGYYSSYKGNGAVPGFIFKTEERARQLLQFLGGDENPESSNQPENYLAMNADPSKGTTPMSAFETRVFNQDGDPFKLYEAVIDIVAKYNPGARLGQNNLKSGTTGTFYMPSRSLRVKGLNSVAVAFHELVHALDYQNQVISDFIKNTKPGNALRKQLGDVFLRYYPKAHPNTDFRKKMIEGYATFIEKYIEKPTEINQRYPDLVQAFLKPGGQHYFNTMSDFLTDAEKVVTAYQQLSPLDKIGSRVVSDRMEDLTPKYLSNTDKFTKELFDALSPIEKLAEQDGTHMTQGDVSLWMRLSNNAMQLAQKNISSHRGEFWSMNDRGEWNKSHDFNFNTLIKSLDKRGVTTDFAHYLVARRVDAEWRERNTLEKQLQNPKLDPKDRMEFEDQFNRLEGILKADGISEIEAQEATAAGSTVFAQDEKMFDAMVQEGLDMAHNPLVQLIDDEGYEKMMSKEGYAPFKRQQYDELVGDTEIPLLTNTAGKTKVGAFMARRGSTKPIINPLISAMANHAEILRKSMKQMVYNKFLDVAKLHPDVFLEVPLTVNPDSQNRFPQEKNPDIIMARRNQKRVPILVSKEIKQVIDENYQYHNMHILEQVGTSMSQLFRTGTTGIFWQFFINNSFLDQVAATTNTRNGMMPFISSIRHAAPALLNVGSEKLFGKAVWFPHSKEAAYLKEYLFLAGSAQTFLSADITSQKSMEDTVFGQPKTWNKRVADYLSAVVNLLSVPGNVSEIATRFTEYYLARRTGKSQVVALEEAGRVSTPFHHSGRLGGPVGKSYVRSIPYFNASLQVLRQTKRTLNTLEGRKRYAFTALSMLAASAGSMLYILGKDDDDEQKKILRTLAPDDLSKYLYFPNPYSSKRLIKVRVPEQLGWLAAMQNMALIQGSNQTDYRWSEWGEAAGSFMPTQLNPFNPTQMLFSYVPPMVKTPVESMVGIKTYPGIRPIENEHDKRLPAELRYNKYTSPVARELGDLLGWSPKKIDHFVEGVFGRSIKYLTGKGGTYGVQQIFEKELYFEASRQIQFYYTVKERNARQVKAYEDGLKAYIDPEVDRMLKTEELLGDIDNGLQDFKETDAEKNPMEATKIRNQVFDLIRELEKLDE